MKLERFCGVQVYKPATLCPLVPPTRHQVIQAALWNALGILLQALLFGAVWCALWWAAGVCISHGGTL